MHVTIKYNDLRRLAGFCGPISKLGTDVTSSGVLLSSVPGGLCAQTATPDVWAKGTLPAEISQQGEGLVPGAIFADVVKALGVDSDDEIEVSVLDDEIDIWASGGRIHRTLRLIPPDDFATRASLEPAERVKVAPDVAEFISKASFAASRDSMAGALGGVHVYPGGLVATDKYKFVIIDFEWEGITPTNLPIDLVKHFPAPENYGDGEIYLSTAQQTITFEFGQLTVSGSTLEGTYPDPQLIREFLPDESPYSFEVEVSHLKALIGALGPMVPSLGGATLHPDGVLRVVSDIGSAQDRLEASVNIPCPIILNLGFLRNVVSLFRDESTCKFIFNQDEPDFRPFCIVKDHVTLGCMPMRLT